MSKINIWVIRHGQTNWNVLKKIQGQTDIELNDTGRAQARETSNKIKDEKIDLIISSPLKRAKETAEIINENFNVSIIEDERLKERYFGTHEGLTKDEIQEFRMSHPNIDIWSFEKNIDIDNIENLYNFSKRIYNCLDEIVEKYNDKNVLLVTHAGTTGIIKAYFKNYKLGEEVDKETLKAIDNCEVLKFVV